MKKNNSRCPNCGGSFKYNADLNVLSCERCASQEYITDTPAPPKKILMPDSCPKKIANVKYSFECSSCGAPLNASEVINTKCPYCGSTSFCAIENSLTHMPDSIIPFAISKEKAITIYKSWIKKRKFAPNDLKKKSNLKEIKGIYYPCWLFDYNTSSVYSGVGVNRERRTDKDGHTYTVEHSRHFASSTFNKYVNQIEPANDLVMKYSIEQFIDYSYQPFVKYDSRYLLGFSTLNFDKDLHTSFKDECSQKRAEIEQEIKASLGFDYYKSFICNTNFDNVKWSYSLLPIWVCNFKYKKKNYNFMINGKTGNIKGKTPKSGLKIFSLIAGILLGAGLIALIISLL